MALGIIVDSIAGLSDELKQHYVPTGNGKFRLDATAGSGWSLEENIGGLKSALESERDARAKAERALKAFDGVDVDRYSTLEAENAKLKTAKPDDKLKMQFEEQTQALVKSHEQALGKYKQDIDALNEVIAEQMIDSVATQAITAAGGIPVAPKLLKPVIRSATRVVLKDDGKRSVEVVGETGVARVSTVKNDGTYMTVSELVDELKANEEFQPLFKGTGASGTGASGSSGGPSGTFTAGAKTIKKSEFDSMDGKSRAALLVNQETGNVTGVQVIPD